MPPILALLLQAAAAPPGTLPAIDFDLARYHAAGFDLGFGERGCRRSGDEILVCGRRDAGAYPLERMERLYGPRRLMAELGIAGALRGDVHVERVNLDPSATDSALPHDISNRVMIGLRLPF